MVSSLECAILQTLAYADIFRYPLTESEIGSWLNKPLQNSQNLSFTLKKLSSQKKIYKKDAYYFLFHHSGSVMLRIKRTRYSIDKLKKASRLAKLLELIPTIELVGVTGSLSMKNGDKSDDIDFLIICKSGWIWTTRCIVTLIFQILGVRRKPLDTHVANKICLNMYLDSKHLQIPKSSQDIFSAHELLQLKVLWARHDMYEKLILQNRWVEHFLPNKFNDIIQTFSTVSQEYKNKNTNGEVNRNEIHFIEKIFKQLQLAYMAKRRTSEKISEGMIQFHPNDIHGNVLRAYSNRLNKLGMRAITPLDKKLSAS